MLNVLVSVHVGTIEYQKRDTGIIPPRSLLARQQLTDCKLSDVVETNQVERPAKFACSNLMMVGTLGSHVRPHPAPLKTPPPPTRCSLKIFRTFLPCISTPCDRLPCPPRGWAACKNSAKCSAQDQVTHKSVQIISNSRRWPLLRWYF